MAAATILQQFTGSDVFYDGTGKGSHDLDKDGVPDLAGQYILTKLAFEYYDGPPIDLTWETFTEAAEEAGISRIYGGIHFQDGNLFGRGIGLEVSDSTWAASQKYITGNAGALLQSPVGTAASDLLIGSDAAETFDAGAGDDTVRPNGGGDVVTLGAGNDRIEGLSFALDNIIVRDFAQETASYCWMVLIRCEGSPVPATAGCCCRWGVRDKAGRQLYVCAVCAKPRRRSHGHHPRADCHCQSCRRLC